MIFMLYFPGKSSKLKISHTKDSGKDTSSSDSRKTTNSFGKKAQSKILSGGESGVDLATADALSSSSSSENMRAVIR